MQGGDTQATMQQLFLARPGQLELRHVDPPRAGPGEVVVKIRAALTCGTDLKTYRRGHPKLPMPTPFGHEFSGDVHEVGPGVRRFRKGQGVVLAPTAPCGDCYHCRRGLGNLCDFTINNMVLGAFAEYVKVPAHIVAHNMYPKPEGLSYLEAAILEPLSCVVYGCMHLPMGPRDTVVIIGAGPIGLLFLMLARLRGVGRVIVAGRRSLRLKAARRLGADHIIDVHRTSVEDEVRRLTAGRGADVVVECTGQPAVWEQAIGLAGSGGTVMLYGGCASGSRVNVPVDRLLLDGLTIKGVFHFTPEAVREAYRLLAGRALAVSTLITGIYPLTEFRRVFDTLSRGEAIKLALVP